MAKTDAERVTDLEIKVTYQDQTIETLNQVVIELRSDVERLERALKLVEQQVIAGPPGDPANERPPHY